MFLFLSISFLHTFFASNRLTKSFFYVVTIIIFIQTKIRPETASNSLINHPFRVLSSSSFKELAFFGTHYTLDYQHLLLQQSGISRLMLAVCYLGRITSFALFSPIVRYLLLHTFFFNILILL